MTFSCSTQKEQKRLQLSLVVNTWLRKTLGRNAENGIAEFLLNYVDLSHFADFVLLIHSQATTPVQIAR